MALFLVLGLVLASCGSGDSDADGLTAPVETSGPLVAYTQTPLHTPRVGQPIAYPFFPPNQGQPLARVGSVRSLRRGDQ